MNALDNKCLKSVLVSALEGPVHHPKRPEKGVSRCKSLKAPPEEVKATIPTPTTASLCPNPQSHRGSFEKIMLMRSKASNDLLAMKNLRKDALLGRKQVEHTRTER